MACDCTPEWNDGEVVQFTWGTAPAAMVLINACGVKQVGTYYANYTWDPATGILHVAAPTNTIPPPPGQAPAALARRIAHLEDNPMITRVDIDCWGTSLVAPPTPWTGTQPSGTVSIEFTVNGSISGPVGGVTGP